MVELQTVLTFDGSNFVTLGKKDRFKIRKNITLEAWVYAIANQEWTGIISNVYDSGSTESGYGILLDGKSGVYFGLTIPSQGIQYLSSGVDTLKLNEWHHIAGTYDGQQMTVYVDGVAKANKSIASSSINYNPENDLSIGMYKDNNETYTFKGKIAEVRLWDRIRSQDEIEQSMNHRLRGDEPGLVGYWPLNEGSSNIAQDKTANGNNGTINGATWEQSEVPLTSIIDEGIDLRPWTAESVDKLVKYAKAWVWAHQPTVASYKPSSCYQYNSYRNRNDANTITHQGTGQYTVELPGLGKKNGIIHVAPYGNTNHSCQLVSWETSGTTKKIKVCCFKDGRPMDGLFTLLFYKESRKKTERDGAYLWADRPTDDEYIPNKKCQWNSKGVSNTVRRLKTGVYQIEIPEMSQSSGVFLATACDSPESQRTAKVKNWKYDGNNLIVDINCFDAHGNLADSQFTFTYMSDSDIPIESEFEYNDDDDTGELVKSAKAWVWANQVRVPSYVPHPFAQYNSYYNRNDCNRIFCQGTGQYLVDLPGLATSRGIVHVSPYGNSNHSCQVNFWGPAGTTQRIQVYCFKNGFLTDGLFTLLFYKESRQKSQREGAYLWADRPTDDYYTPNKERQWNSKGFLNKVCRLDTGVYQIELPGLSQFNGVVLATACSPISAKRLAKVKGWTHDGSNLVIEVNCFHPNGQLADSQFTFSYMSDVQLGQSESDEQHHGGFITYTPSQIHQLNTQGVANSVQRSSAGNYIARLPNLPPTQTTQALVTPIGESSKECVIRWWGNYTDLYLSCLDNPERSVDSAFSLLYLTNHRIPT
ncbi:LamG domain-containing protein [Geitlerinema sp. CS-897]|nr:LamG domain-containing protein [Geitlerinema sp. CS-897]